jgi:3'-phosphoadenosine 5'-phosphosulfate sulfotransferase (PAPS reductase)/FAD synthetase
MSSVATGSIPANRGAAFSWVMILLPLFWDQHDNAQRMHELGFGVRLPTYTFSDDDMALYERLHELPRNPLSERGYPSIGCWPCTRPVAPGEDKRAGRWAGSDKTECGLHL